MLRRWWPAIVGVVLLGISAAAYGVVTWRDNRLHHEGVVIQAQVVRLVPAQGWDPFDSGRVVVRYATGAGEWERTIWLDDWSDRPTSATWPVRYDPAKPGRVQSVVTSDNDPAPWAILFVGAGLAGLVMLTVGLWHGIRRRRVAKAMAALPIPARDVLPLKGGFRLAYLEVAGNELRLHLPQLLADGTAFVLAADQVGLSEPGDPALDDLGGEWVWVEPLVVPDLGPGATTRPNLELLFRSPVAAPHWRGRTVRHRGLPDEPFLDGVGLGFVDPAAARARLLEAGVSVVTRPDTWLARTRAISRDPEQIAAVGRMGRWQWGLYGAWRCVQAASLVALFIDRVWVVAVAAVFFALTLGIEFHLKRQGKKLATQREPRPE